MLTGKHGDTEETQRLEVIKVGDKELAFSHEEEGESTLKRKAL